MTITTTLECTGDGINTVTVQRPGTYCDNSAQQQYSSIRDGSSGQKISETESDILVIGLDILPWRSGPTETFNLPSFTKSNCTVRDLPVKWRDGNSYVGGLTAEGPMICGNGNFEQFSSCYRLESNGTWKGLGGMKMTLRQHAAAVRLEDGWWVTGGYDSDKENTDSTELWDGQSWRSHDPLPVPTKDHCLVRLNHTHVFLTGGFDGGSYTAASYFYSKATGFLKAPDMLGKRVRHSCGLHDGRFVIVAGGDGDDRQKTKKSSQYFNLETLTWHEGPSVDTYDFGQHLVSWGSHTYCIGRKIIWELVKSAEDDEGNVEHIWEWVKVGETESDRRFNFQAFLVSSQDCRGWK